MTESGSSAGTRGGSAAPPAWLRNVAVWVGVALALVVLVVLGVAVLPPWWASLIGGWVDGVQSRGVLLGLVLGIAFTLLPIGVALLALRSGIGSRTRIALIVAALLLLLPSVLTIAISLGTSDARSVMVIEAPGFAVSTVVGIGLTVLVTVGVIIGRSRGRRTSRQLENARGKAVQRNRDLAGEAEESGGAGDTGEPQEAPDPAPKD